MVNTRSLSAAALLSAAVVALAPSPASGQAGDAAVGAVLGTAGGLLVSSGILTARARAGRFVFSTADLRWQLLPVGVGGAAGGILGYRNGARLRRTVEAGAWGAAAGAAVGALAGRLAWSDPEGAWAGAVIGASTGLLVGSVAGAWTWSRPGNAGPPATFAFTLPVGW